jgi:WD40 repeat protein
MSLRSEKVISATENAGPEIFLSATKALNSGSNTIAVMPKTDWGTAPEISRFYGRVDELNKLSQWIIEERCRLVVIRGMRGSGKTHLAAGFGKRGVGKTDLSLSLAAKVKTDFEYVVWRSLLNSPRISDLLNEIVYFLSDGTELTLSRSPQEHLDLLFSYLASSRCLIIIDNLESILHGGPKGLTFRAGFESYEDLFRRASGTAHSSCIVVNGRESPKSLDRMCGIKTPARLLELQGLDQESSKKVIFDQGDLVGEQAIETLVEYYAGNPLALQLAAKYIASVHFGSVEHFLASEDGVFGDIKELLDWHYDRLSDTEKELMLCLALNREPMTLEELKNDIVRPASKRELGNTVQSFQHRLPLEKTSTAFTLQPVLMEYATERYIAAAVTGIIGIMPPSIDNHLLYKAEAKDYIRDVQDRVIIAPVVDQLNASLANLPSIASCLDRLIQRARELSTQGYAIGNAINLLNHTGIGCAGRDFSGLVIRQAFFQNALLHGTNFVEATILNSVFTTTLGAVLAVEIDPARESLLTGDTTGQVRLWNMLDGAEIMNYQGHTSWVRSIALAPDRSLFASGSSDYTVRVWDIDSGECKKILLGHSDQIYSVAFHRSGELLASGGEDEKAMLWKVDNGENIETIWAHRGRVRSVCFHPHADILVIADEIISLWDLNKRGVVHTLRTGDRYVRQAVYSRDGEYLFVLGEDGPISVFHGPTIDRIAYVTPDERVRCIDVSRDGGLVAGAGDNGQIHIWDWRSGLEVNQLSGHMSSIKAIALRNDDSIIVSGSDDQTVKIWDLKRRHSLRTIKGYGNAIRAVAYSTDGRDLISGGEDGLIRVWRSGAEEPVSTFEGHTQTVQTLAISPQGQLVASGSNDQSVRLWDLHTGACCRILRGHNSWVWNVAFSPDGRLLATASRDYSIIVWDVLSGQRIRTLTGHTDEVHCVVFISPDGLLVSGSDDNSIKLWDANSGELLDTLSGHSNCVRSVAYSARSGFLASGSDDQTVKIWDLRTKKQVVTLHGHSDRVRSVVFRPDGQTVYSSSDDKTIRLWGIFAAQCMGVHHGHESGVWSIAYDPQVDGIVSGSEDGTIRRWKLGVGEPIILRPSRPYEGMNVYGIAGLTDAEVASLKRLGAVQRRPVSLSYAESRPSLRQTKEENMALRDVFICHAGEDKESVVRPLVKTLTEGGISAWFDQAEIRWGDSLTGRVNEGLRISRFIVVVLSPAFIGKNWPERELNSALNIEASTGQVKVLPILVGTVAERAAALERYPLLNDKAYIVWDGSGAIALEALRRRLT